jgi:hypothetical protein
MDGSKSAEMQTAPSAAIGNNTSNSRSTASPRLGTTDDKSSSRGTKRGIEGRGYAGTLGATVSERMLIFSNASSSSRSNSPMPLPKEEKSKRVLREGWIKKELSKEDDENQTKTTDSVVIENVKGLGERQHSPAQTEKPLSIIADDKGSHHVISHDGVDDVTNERMRERMSMGSIDNNTASVSQQKERRTSDGIKNVLSPIVPRIPLEIIVPNRRDSTVAISPEFKIHAEHSSSVSRGQKNVLQIETDQHEQHISDHKVFSPSLLSISIEEAGLYREEEIVSAPPSVRFRVNVCVT